MASSDTGKAALMERLREFDRVAHKLRVRLARAGHGWAAALRQDLVGDRLDGLLL